MIKITENKNLINTFFDSLPEYMDFSDEAKQDIIDLDIFRIAKKGAILLKEGQQSDINYFVFLRDV